MFVFVDVLLTSSGDHGQAAIVQLLGLHLCESISVQVLGKTKRIKAYRTNDDMLIGNNEGRTIRNTRG